MTLTFDQDGQAQGLYSEEIDLRELGTLELRRASTIEFNAIAQKWEVRLPYVRKPVDFHCDGLGELLYSHVSRDECLKWERRYFDAQ